MKNITFVFLLIILIWGCNKTDEVPLFLPLAAEPSAKLHNDRGIEFFHRGKELDALIAFTQANVADNSSGEIHFNLGLMQHSQEKFGQAKGHFKLALKFADGNKKILQSSLLKKYLD